MNNLAEFYHIHQYSINVTRLCKKCGISRATFYKIINGDVLPRVDTAIKICKYLRENHKCDFMRVEYAFMELLKYPDRERQS